MKDSGIAWIGEIPDNWETVKLKFLLSKNDGGVWGEDPKEFMDNNTVLRSTEQTVEGYWDISSPAQRYLGNISNLSFYLIKKDDLLITKSSGSSLHIGKTTLATKEIEEKKYYYSNFLQRLHTKKELLASFLWRILNTNCSREQFVYMQNSTSGIGNINAENINNLIIPLTSILEQQKIADYLDGKCGEIDILKEDIKKQIETLEQYKRSVITEAVTKGLNKSALMKDSGIPWIGVIPENWGICPNKYVMKKVKRLCVERSDENILSLTMKGVVIRDLDAGGKMPTSFNGYQYVKKGNLLMCLFDIDVTPRCIGLVRNNGITSPAYSQFEVKNACANYYLYYYLMMDFTKELLHLSKNLRYSLTEEQFGAINTIVPPITEQQQIADYLDKKCAEIDKIISDKQSQIETLEEYKKSLIFEYVTGKKQVG